VVFVAGKEVSTLSHLAGMRVAVAEDGKSGVGRDRTGRKGKRRSLNVPVGTVVWEVDEEGDKTQLADLTEPGMQVIGARGGSRAEGIIGSRRRRIKSLCSRRREMLARNGGFYSR
jgi:GTP-binding protein